MKYYLIGIGGAGMSVVAQLLVAEGHEVLGSDREESENTELLRGIGVTVYIGHEAANVPEDAVLVVSSAIKENNPELAVARARGQQVLHRSQALALAAGERDFIAVAGAHGKTSTSSMLAMALTSLGLDPSRAIGGSIVGGLSGGYLGQGNVLVAEADESDASFLNYTPRIAIVTNVEPDHLDHYGTKENFEQAFVDFAHCIVPGGLLICCGDDAGALRLAQQAASEGVRVRTYGRKSVQVRGAHYEGHVQLIDTEDALDDQALLSSDGAQYQLRLHVPGSHMRLNAAGAWLAAVELGESGEDAAKALTDFGGASRRFELVGEVAGIRVIDDYAHHPTEIAATLETARDVCKGSVRVLFQPHLYSRTRNFAREFADVLSRADDVIITGVYAAREVPSDGAQGNVISDLMDGVPFIEDRFDAAREIARHAEPGDLVLTVGAGNVTQTGATIVSELEQRYSAAENGRQ